MNKYVGILMCFSLFLITGCKENADTVVSGLYLACATHGDEVSCWSKGYTMDSGDYHFKVNNFRKQYVDPTISVGNKHLCVLDQNEVECHILDDEFKPLETPELSNPYEIAAGSDFTCALDDTGLVCWGDADTVTSEIPESFSNPRKLVAGLDHICLQDDSSFDCYGFSYLNFGKPTPPSFITNPEKLTTSSASDITCALQDEAWTCWHNEDPNDATGYFDFPDADLVVPAYQQTCALTDGEITCKSFGVADLSEEIPENVANPTHLDISPTHACALTSYGVSCWAPSSAALFTPTNVPLYLNSSFPPQL